MRLLGLRALLSLSDTMHYHLMESIPGSLSGQGFSLKGRASVLYHKVEWWMLWISWVGIQNWWKSIEVPWPFCKCSLSFFFFFQFFLFVILIFHARWQCLSTSAWQGNWFNLSRGEEILLFHVSFYIHSLRNCRWETGFWWATYGWTKKNADFFFPFFFVQMEVYSSWSIQACIGWMWDELGLSFNAVPKELHS